MIAFQERLHEYINDKDAHDLIINVINGILTKDENRWARVDGINH